MGKMSNNSIILKGIRKSHSANSREIFQLTRKVHQISATQLPIMTGINSSSCATHSDETPTNTEFALSRTSYYSTTISGILEYEKLFENVSRLVRSSSKVYRFPC